MSLGVNFHSGMHVESSLSPNMHFLPEGYLLCVGVPIARTGKMYYGPGELPLKVGDNGIIEVTRDEAVVFSPQTMASFEGKPITLDHPLEDVSPKNWKRLACGYLRNVRRGDGKDHDKLIADAVINDEDAIQMVLSGKRGVSCGYDARYEQTSPGRARQIKISGNHAALVSNPRCGEACSIRDEAKMTKLTKKQFASLVRDAFKTRDEQKLNEALTRIGAGPAMAPDQQGVGTNPTFKSGQPQAGSPEAESGATHVHVHLNNPAAPTPVGAAQGDAGAGPAAPGGGGEFGDQSGSPMQGTDTTQQTPAVADPLSQLLEMMENLLGRITALEGSGGAPAPGGGGSQMANQPEGTLPGAGGPPNGGPPQKPMAGGGSQGNAQGNGGSPQKSNGPDDGAKSAPPKKTEDAPNWQAIYAANKATIGGDPNKIMPGQKLSVGGADYTVQKGDTLTSIAARQGGGATAQGGGQQWTPPAEIAGQQQQGGGPTPTPPVRPEGTGGQQPSGQWTAPQGPDQGSTVQASGGHGDEYGIAHGGSAALNTETSGAVKTEPHADVTAQSTHGESTGTSSHPLSEYASADAAATKANGWGSKVPELHTADSSALIDEWRSTVAKAEILSPGISLPTFDSKSPEGKTRDAMCMFKRRSLAMVMTDEPRSELVKNFIPDSIEKSPGGVAGMTCDGVNVLFQAAAEAARTQK